MIRPLSSLLAVLAALVHVVHGECPAGTVPGPGQTEYCYSFSEGTADWKQAKLECANKNGWLASSPNAFVNRFLSTGDAGEHWLIATSFGDSDFYWEDGTNMTYTNWARGEPAPHPRTEWKSLVLQAVSGLWTTADIKAQKKYICQFPPVVTIQAPKPTPAGATNCDEDWTYLKTAKKCVKPVHGKQRYLQWNEALQQCRREGGDLLSIHSKAEWDEINCVVDLYVQVAIGLYLEPGSCAAGSCTPRWTDGSAVDYQAWMDTQPHADFGVLYGGCVHTLPSYSCPADPIGLWTNDPCYQKNGYVCQNTPHV